MKVRYAAAALRQIDEALAYLAARSPQGAAGLRTRILRVGADEVIVTRLCHAARLPV